MNAEAMPLPTIPSPFGRIKPMISKEFRRLRDFMESATGVNLTDAKKALVSGRLIRRIRQLGMHSYGEYAAYAMEHPVERQLLIDALCTNETHFFREPQHFEFMERKSFPNLQERRRKDPSFRKIRAWSAACSTGEEPFTLAMLLLANFPPEDGWEIEVVASDISRKVLHAAEKGEWPIARSSEIPEVHLKRFMLRGVGAQDGIMRAKQELRNVVRFHQLNLVQDAPFAIGQFDFVFCRNVLIYFAAETKQKVIRRLLEHVAPEGFLMLGHAETILSHPQLIRAAPAVYGVGKIGGRPSVV